jgi:hypothetical protein
MKQRRDKETETQRGKERRSNGKKNKNIWFCSCAEAPVA